MSKSPKKSSNLKNLALLSGIAVEMGVIIFLAAKGGIYLDETFETNGKLFTALLTMSGVGIALWVVLRQLKKLNP